MAANLNQKDDKYSIAYTGETPWHKNGQRIAEAFDAATALREANLDYTVEKVAIQTFDGHSIPDRYAIRRTDTKDVLGLCAGMYKPLQNREAFSFFDGVFGKDKARFETAGVLGKGETIWLLARLPGEFTVGKSDLIGKWLLLVNGHNTKDPVRAKFTPIRVVCQNTVNAALSGKQSEVRIQHIGAVQQKLEIAGKLLSAAGIYFDEMQDTFNGFLKVSMKEKALRSYFTRVIAGDKPEDEISKIAERQIARITELHDTGRGHDIKGVRGSLWGAYNAVTEYVDHDRTSDGVGFMLNGRGAELKQRAFEVGKELAIVGN
jgi:phage/plasmid-like protein (TIGR03299 family)